MRPDPAQFRDRTHYMAAVASEIAAPALRAYAALRARRPPTPSECWRSGVIIGSGHIGDVLYRTCSLAELALGLPNCEWSYATSSEGNEILRGNPAITMTLPYDEFMPSRSGTELRKRAFDVVLCTDNIEHHKALWFATRLGIPNRVAFVQKGFGGLATVPVRTGRAPWPEQIRAMINLITGTPHVTPLRPRIYPDDRDYDAAHSEWAILPYHDADLTIAAHVTTRQQRGAVPHALFASVFRDILDEQPRARIVLSGTKEDSPALHAIASAIGPRAIVRAGTLGLRAYAAFLKRCDAFVGTDSGPRHMANAAGIPVFFVRNLGVPAIETGRYCATETDLAPAGEYLSQAAAARCLDQIDHRVAARLVLDAARRHHSDETKAHATRIDPSHGSSACD